MSDDLVKQSIAELQDLVRCRCHEAYKGRGLHDPTCCCDYAEALKVVSDRIEELETLIKDFFILLDKKEETDEGRVFRPNRISSCRAEDGQKLENLLRLMKATVEGRW